MGISALEPRISMIPTPWFSSLTIDISVGEEIGKKQTTFEKSTNCVFLVSEKSCGKLIETKDISKALLDVLTITLVDNEHFLSTREW